MRYIAIFTGFLIATLTTIGAHGSAVKSVVRDLAAIRLAQDDVRGTTAAKQG
ncbi:MAG TPA: hypothetical protein VHZ78_16475 [Rhizomicrobium sp.]|jgi:hypothetical protein|nr:hypothetical protein [Rhizomicrobium sp.]